MRSLKNKIKRRKSEILRISRRYGASNIRIFGSVARGQETQNSDIDLLVKLDNNRSLLDLAGLLVELEELLNHKVDVTTERGLKPRIRDRVLKEAVSL